MFLYIFVVFIIYYLLFIFIIYVYVFCFCIFVFQVLILHFVFCGSLFWALGFSMNIASGKEPDDQIIGQRQY
jgi:hypothetical protein